MTYTSVKFKDMMKSIPCTPNGLDELATSINDSLTSLANQNAQFQQNASNGAPAYIPDIPGILQLKQFSGKPFATEKDMTEFILGKNNTNDIFMGVVLEENWSTSLPKDFIYTIRPPATPRNEQADQDRNHHCLFCQNTKFQFNSIFDFIVSIINRMKKSRFKINKSKFSKIK